MSIDYDAPRFPVAPAKIEKELVSLKPPSFLKPDFKLQRIDRAWDNPHVQDQPKADESGEGKQIEWTF
jgi:hypothetical protein